MENYEKKIEAFKTLLENKKKIVFFGGAGVSTASGIPDFRSPSGLYSKGKNEGKPWSHYPPEALLSHSFFMEHTDWFYDYYKANVLYPDAKPSACHNVLAAWEAQDRLLSVITQNIDGLHQKAGSKLVNELHGTTLDNYCMRCGASYDLDAVLAQEGVPYCTKSSCDGVIKPKVTLYEEQLPEGSIERAVQDIRQADLLIIAGTSLAVYPAAGLVNYFLGEDIVLINLGKTPMDGVASIHLPYDINQVFQDISK